MITKLLVLSMAVASCKAILDSTGCPTAFKTKCHCGMAYSIYDNSKAKKFTVNCTNAHFDDASMLLDLPEQTEVLIFVGNSVPTLPANVLDNFKDYDNLETIDLTNNNIRFIQGKSFHKVYNVKNLILDHNDLYITDDKARPRILSNFEALERLHMTNAFTEKVNSTDSLLSLEDIFYESDLVTLKILHLEQNEIWSIGDSEKVFCELPKLQHIYLGDNKLTDFDFRIDCLPDLMYIDLERNMISRLSEDAMTRLDTFQQTKHSNLTVKLDENPFNCDCRAIDFLQWVKGTKVDVMQWKEYYCFDGYPQENVGKTFTEIRDLRCPGSQSPSNTKSTPSNAKSSPSNTKSTANAVRDHVEGSSSTYHYKEEASHRAGHSSATIGVLSFFLVFTSSLLLAVAYFHRKKMKDLVLPYWDFMTRKIGYTGIAPEEAPQEVSV